METRTCPFCLHLVHENDVCDIDGEAGCVDCKHVWLEGGHEALRAFAVKVAKVTPGTEAYKAEQRRLARNLSSRLSKAKKRATK